MTGVPSPPQIMLSLAHPTMWSTAAASTRRRNRTTRAPGGRSAWAQFRLSSMHRMRLNRRALRYRASVSKSLRSPAATLSTGWTGAEGREVGKDQRAICCYRLRLADHIPIWRKLAEFQSRAFLDVAVVLAWHAGGEDGIACSESQGEGASVADTVRLEGTSSPRTIQTSVPKECERSGELQRRGELPGSFGDGADESPQLCVAHQDASISLDIVSDDGCNSMPAARPGPGPSP